MRGASSCGSGAQFKLSYAGCYKEFVLQVTARRTYVLSERSAYDTLSQAAQAGDLAADCGAIGERLYVRTSEAVATGEALAAGTEIFICTLLDATRAHGLAAELRGSGGIAAISACAVFDCTIVIEIAHNFTLLFAFIDACTRRFGPTQRRSLFPLHDATLIAVTALAWNCRELEPLRILEVAAGGEMC